MMESSSSSTGSVSSSEVYPYSPSKFLWAYRQITTFNSVNRHDDIVDKIFADLSEPAFPYGLKTCTLVGKLIKILLSCNSPTVPTIIDKLLHTELATSRSQPKNKVLYDAIWNEFLRSPFVLSKAITKVPPDKIEALRGLPRLDQSIELRKHFLISSRGTPTLPWLTEIVKFAEARCLTSDNFESILAELVKRLDSKDINLTTELGKKQVVLLIRCAF
jgi:hypothetical protein